MKDNNESSVIACEIKIGVAGQSFEKVRKLIDKIREACATSDYKLEVRFSGDFFKEQCPHESI